MESSAGRRDQKSRQSGRSRLSRAASGVVQSVPPSATTDRTGPHTPQRMSVQPPVCGVQPGKVLELRTTLGLMRARALLDRQLELELQLQEEDRLRGGGGEQRQLMTSGRLKHGRLQPLGLISDPTMASNACLGIVSVSTQQSYQRPRSCTTPGVEMGNPRPVCHGGSSAGKSIRQRSYSAMLPHNTAIGRLRLKELTATMSVTEKTSLVPEEKPIATTITNSKITNPIKTSDNDDGNQTTETSQTDISHHKDKAQNSSMTDNKLEMRQTSSDKLQILPPVVRHGELAMKVEVRRLKASRDSTTSDSNQVATAKFEKTEQSIATNCIVGNRLPQISANGSKSPATPSESETNSGQTRAAEDASGSRSTPSSPTKVSIVSVGEASTARPRSQHLHRRRRRHSEGRLPGSGRLSKGWSPPQAIEPLVGSPLHTPRKQSQVKGKRECVNEEQDKELDATRSLMTSPGLMINVDVNEFLQDTDADDPA